MNTKQLTERYGLPYHLGTLRDRCLRNERDFLKLPDTELWETKSGAWFVFIPKPNAKVLAVAHLDSVCKSKHFTYGDIGDDFNVFNGQLDDRLGAYIILDLLPKLGLEYDILLTTGEESGRSTAANFRPVEGVDYNWMFEWDRTGDDVVMYQYENRDSVKLLEKHGFRHASGSSSDIDRLDHLGVLGFNFGCGYKEYHTERAYVSLNMLTTQIQKFLPFFAAHKDTKMVYDPKVCGRGKAWSSTTTYGNQTSYYGRGYLGADGAANDPNPTMRGLNGNRLLPGAVTNLSTQPVTSRTHWFCDCASNFNRKWEEEKCDICGAKRDEYLRAGSGIMGADQPSIEGRVNMQELRLLLRAFNGAIIGDKNAATIYNMVAALWKSKGDDGVKAALEAARKMKLVNSYTIEDIRKLLFPAPPAPDPKVEDTQPVTVGVNVQPVINQWRLQNLAVCIYNVTGTSDYQKAHKLAEHAMEVLSSEQQRHFAFYLTDVETGRSVLSFEAMKQVIDFIADNGRITHAAINLASQLTRSIAIVTGCTMEVAQQKSEEIFKRIHGDEAELEEYLHMIRGILLDWKPEGGDAWPLTLDEIDELGVYYEQEQKPAEVASEPVQSTEQAL